MCDGRFRWRWRGGAEFCWWISDRALTGLRLAFLTDGLRWRASYALVMQNESRGSFSGQAVIENTGQLTIRAAEIQLLAGVVRRPQVMRRTFQPVAVMTAEAEVQTVGETRVYTVPEPADFVAGETSSMALVPAVDAAIEREYVVRPSRFGHLSQWTEAEQELRAEVSYLVRRPLGSPFGSRPLPAGTVRVFAPDSARRLQLIGETQIDHTPEGRELHLTTGSAFDVTAERTQMTYERRGDRDAVASYRVVVRNAKDTQVVVQVLDEFPGQNEILSSTVRPERLSSSSVCFPVAVPAGGEAALEYRVRARW